MTIYLIISAIQALFLRSTDEGKPLYKLKEKWSYVCPKWMRKATIECIECRSLWLSIFTGVFIAFQYDPEYLLSIPLLMILTYIGYQILQ